MHQSGAARSLDTYLLYGRIIPLFMLNGHDIKFRMASSPQLHAIPSTFNINTEVIEAAHSPIGEV
jgi:hypothetical protein